MAYRTLHVTRRMSKSRTGQHFKKKEKKKKEKKEKRERKKAKEKIKDEK